ncbi:putative transcription factor IIS, TFIIS/LEDGF domain superfamily [Arabidopsis thaliana]|uniref:TFIIS N-terminal domain-containing protein n=4 Tax=Arabidopsis TaxID=3701 RepID=A0A178W2R6_ARATH|nr:hypothetical protein [Arabidopsis thaliana]KAG7638270.1 Transcription factor IIS N-terminal [Arabidopsis thaliana x Arabidopsis arenosa]OAP11633.1 hypothetical protein AXX17_AT2G29190 [Arabidopsis thaliana]CAA0374213.1 unnamed protein product [Arabidopsis thaliana]VYS54253.1 unnamed protein product [Arabidopsis thaliana]
MVMKIAIATERTDLPRLVSTAIRASNSQNASDVERCFDVLRYLKGLNLSVKNLSHSKVILPLESLRDHENPKIRTEAHVLFTSWMKTFYSSGQNSSSTCNKPNPLKLKKVVKACSELKKKNEEQLSHGFAVLKAKKETVFLGMKKNEDERSRVHETREMKQIGDSKSFALMRTIEKKKQSASPIQGSKNPRSGAGETGVIKKILRKPDFCCKSVPSRPPLNMKKHQPVKAFENPKTCLVLKKNSPEMLELFEMAKKSADVANAKGFLAAKEEASICVDILALLMKFSIISTAIETRRIMEKLERLTKHKDRKICNAALALLHHWRQTIRNQQQ